MAASSRPQRRYRRRPQGHNDGVASCPATEISTRHGGLASTFSSTKFPGRSTRPAVAILPSIPIVLLFCSSIFVYTSTTFVFAFCPTNNNRLLESNHRGRAAWDVRYPSISRADTSRVTLHSASETNDDNKDADEEVVSGAPLFVDLTSRNGYSGREQANGDSGVGFDDALQASFDRVRESIDSDGATSGAGAAKRINLAIVERGQLFTALSTQIDGLVNEELLLSWDEPQRVPGCVATVRVKTTLVPIISEQQSAGSMNSPAIYRVKVDGDADALLSKGLLALLSEALSGGVGDDKPRASATAIVTAQDILNLDPKSVADMLGLRTVLSTGRNDGLASMTTVIQDQIRQLLLVGKDEVIAADTKAQQQSLFEGDKSQQHGRRPTVAMLLSGGVDSSVALNLLVRQNYNVTAFYLKIWLEDELSHLGQCPWEDDYNVCQAVCNQAGVPLETVSLQKQYKERVISYTVDEARRGRTPNPDIMCNSRVKFGCFYDAIADRGFDYVASGHYAQLEEAAEEDNDDNNDNNDGNQKNMRLLRAPDPVKDQTYFLCALTQEQLSKVKFPIGSYQKSQVRDLAHQFNLPNRNRPDSQGLCFLGKVKFDEFINAYLGTDPGDILDATTGHIIGRHKGLWYHTVGQRKGIGKVLNPIESSRGPWYIVAKDRERNAIIASNNYDQEAFEEARSDFYVEDITWIAGSPPPRLFASSGEEEDETGRRWNDGRFTMKIRHGPSMINGTLSLDENEADGTGGDVHLDTKDKGLAPGQYCVFYNLDDEECLGAGVISERHWARLFSGMKDAESMTDVDVPVI